MSIETWLYPTAHGLYCELGDFYIDPSVPVERAVVTHGHSDHARAGHGAVLATAETIAIMQVRMGAGCAGRFQAVELGAPLDVGDIVLRLVPAGHILGSAQIIMDRKSGASAVGGAARAVVTGDYKRHADPTARPFEPVACDLLVTEATFGLPVFRHEPDIGEIAKLLASLRTFPERTHLVGAYGLGKCQRIIALLRRAGYDAPIWLHGAMQALCDLYARLGIPLGDLRAATDATRAELAGAIVLCPPSALADRWSRRAVDPVTVFASGWMRVRARARQRGVELPLIVSDHADWPELLATIADSGAAEVWVTHGREDALVHQIRRMGLRGRALALVGRDEEGE